MNKDDKSAIRSAIAKIRDELYPGASIIFAGSVMYHAWECDPLFAVLKVDGRNILVTTDHGRPVETDLEWLEERIKEATAVLDGYSRAYALTTDLSKEPRERKGS